MQFEDFKHKVQERFQKMIENQTHLYLTDVDKDVIWNTYLAAFPVEQRQEHTCNACKHFLRPFGNIVAIENNIAVSIWAITCEEPFQTVANQLNDLVVSKPIRDVFVSSESKLGIDSNVEHIPNATTIRWQHLFLNLPHQFLSLRGDSIESKMGEYRAHKDVFKRSLEEITLSALETVLELINQNSIYRGEEFKGVVTTFLSYHRIYQTISDKEKDGFAWKNSVQVSGTLAKIRNTAIGTLLTDISEGKELDIAVAAFERIMAPANYKRPVAIVTARMVEEAQKTIADLGLTNSLQRRHAKLDDITVNNVLFVNRDVKKAMNIFDELKESTAINPKSFSKTEEISINDFITKVLPTTTAIELFIENKHSNNFMTLVAPVDESAPSMFKWNNNFSWSYVSNLTDSIKEQVKAAGGNVVGELRASLSWFNYDDLDLHVIEPNGNRIHFGNKQSRSSGTLDVDMNVSPTTRSAVENIIFTNRSQMMEGIYTVAVNQFTKRETKDVGFKVEIEHNGEIFHFEYTKSLQSKEFVIVAEFEYSKTNGLRFIKSLELNSNTISKDIWNVKTNQFVPVTMMMHSPNYWNGAQIGNKHFFFILDKCLNPESPRGFFNEFLTEELSKQRRVFEALGNKMIVPTSNDQLSGLGFSSTASNSVICKVEGTFKRTLKIIF